MKPHVKEGDPNLDWGFFVDLETKEKVRYPHSYYNFYIHSQSYRIPREIFMPRKLFINNESNSNLEQLQYSESEEDKEDKEDEEDKIEKYRLSLPQKRFIGFLFLGTSLLCVSGCAAAAILFVML
jgi:hypothetical protein